MQCAPNQFAREWRGNETLGTERSPMVLVMGLFTNHPTFCSSPKHCQLGAPPSHPQTWAFFQTDETLANFTAAQAAAALSLHGRNWCGLPRRLAEAGYLIYQTKKRQNILMLGRSIASWPPFGREPRHVNSGELLLAWKWIVHAVHSIEALDFFDFWLKIDSDVAFQHPAPFLEQMTTHGAHFMHTMIRKENPGMAQDLLNCTAAYLATAGCSHLQPEAMPDPHSVFYGNAIGGWLGLWQSPQALTHNMHWWTWAWPDSPSRLARLGRSAVLAPRRGAGCARRAGARPDVLALRARQHAQGVHPGGRKERLPAQAERHGGRALRWARADGCRRHPTGDRAVQHALPGVRALPKGDAARGKCEPQPGPQHHVTTSA